MKKVKQLLLIEDDLICAYLVRDMIEETGMAEEIVLCENGQEALDHLNKGIHPKDNQEIFFPELILLDLNMPIMDGYDFLREYMQIEALKGKNIHVIIVSSASFEREKERIENLPASGYIEKPINENKIMEVLSSLAI